MPERWKDSREFCRHVFANHAAQWARNTLQQQQSYAVLNRQAQLDKKVEVQEEVDRLRSQRDLLVGRIIGSGSPFEHSTPQITMSAAAWQRKDLELLSRLCQQPTFRQDMLRKRQQAISTPVPASAADFEQLPVWQRPDYVMQGWVKKMAWQMGSLHGEPPCWSSSLGKTGRFGKCCAWCSPPRNMWC